MSHAQDDRAKAAPRGEHHEADAGPALQLQPAGAPAVRGNRLAQGPGGGGGASSSGAASVLSHWSEGAPVQLKQAGSDMGSQVHTGPKEEAPTAAQVGSATIHALQSHMKLTAMRMYAVAANMHTIIGAPRNEAGVEPAMQGLQQQYDLIMGDLARLNAEIGKVPGLMRGAMSVEIGMLRGAWYDNNGLAQAMGAVYSFTHDKEGRPLADASSFTGSVSDVQSQLKAIYAVLQIDEGDITNRYLPRGTDVAAAVKEATSEAFDSGLDAIQVCIRRLRADLQSMDDQDADVTAADLVAVVSETAASSKGINAKNLATAKRVVRDVEAFQAELAKRSGPKIAKLAKQIGYNSNVSTNLYALNQRMNEVAKEKKH